MCLAVSAHHTFDLDYFLHIILLLFFSHYICIYYDLYILLILILFMIFVFISLCTVNLYKIQTQRICYHAEAGQTHRCRSEHWV